MDRDAFARSARAQWYLTEPSRAIRLQDRFFESLAPDNPQAARVESRLDDNTGTDKQRGMLYDWSLIVNPVDPVSAETALASSAAAVDLALLAWADLESSGEDDTDPLATEAADELALMLIE